MSSTPIIDHYEINVASKPRGDATKLPYHHVARIVLRRGMTEAEAHAEYHRYCMLLNTTDPVYIFKCDLYAVHAQTSHQVTP